MAKKLSLVFGVVFLLVGLLGLLGGAGVVGEEGFFMTDAVHDMVHLVSGIVFLLVGFLAPAKASLWMKIFGVVYLLVSLLGFLGYNPVLGFIVVNNSDNWLHLVLAVVILAAGIKTGKAESPMATPSV